MLAMSLAAPDSEIAHLLARAIEGEGVHLLGDARDRAGLLVAHVALNRAEAGWWGSLRETLERDFHGLAMVDDPQPWALALARKAIARTEDLAHGAYFVLSDDDVCTLGEHVGEAVAVVGDGEHRLFLFDRWWWD